MPLAQNNKYWFVLGRDPILAAAELAVFFRLDNLPFRAGNVVELTQELEGHEIMPQLGGTIKIAKLIETNVDTFAIKNLILNDLKNKNGKIIFGISIYGSPDARLAQQLGLEIKKELKLAGKSARLVTSKDVVLSSVVVEKNKIIEKGGEYILTLEKNNFSLAKTVVVQPFEQFSKRDFGRPGRDDFSGMLPPKLAMIMINLAQAPKSGVLLDPFCGSGTILSEALLMGYKKLFGSDNSEKAIADTKNNIEWVKNEFLTKEEEFEINYKISDVLNISNKTKLHSIDAIVTEPYLGKPLKGNEKRNDLEQQADNLKKLYLNAFDQFRKILKKDGTIIFIIPRFKAGTDWVTINVANEIESAGFQAQNLWQDKKYLVYSRPDQRVAREIWKFKKI